MMKFINSTNDNQSNINGKEYIVEEIVNNCDDINHNNLRKFVKVKYYLKGEILGKGAFSNCYEVKELDSDNVYAIKIIPKTKLIKPTTGKKVISEIILHRSLKHENIVSFKHFFEDRENIYILLEKCSNRTLYDLIKRRKRLYELEVQCYALQILSGLKYIHDNRIIHRDLKLQNLFLTHDMVLKIGDFGLSTKFDPYITTSATITTLLGSSSSIIAHKKYTICGTPNYLAPEILSLTPCYSFEIDIWAFGVIIYTMLIGKLPFECANVKDTYKKIKNIDYSFPNDINISEDAKNLICSIFVANPKSRPTIDDILNHPFLNKTINKIPSILPKYTIVCPPPSEYLKQYGKINKKTRRQISHTISRMSRRNQSVASGSISLFKSINTDNDKATHNLGMENKEDKKVDNIEQQDIKAMQDKLTETLNSKRLSKQLLNRAAYLLTRYLKYSLSLNSSNSVKKPTCTTNSFNLSNIPYIKYFIDLSEQYGIAYKFNTGNFGMVFIDSTKLQEYGNNNENFVYIDKYDYRIRNLDDNDYDRKGSIKYAKEIIQIYNIDNYPKQIENKVNIYNHIKARVNNYNEMDRDQKLHNSKLLNFYGDHDELNANDNKDIIFLKRWFKLKHSYLFRLNNKTIQFNFGDKSILLLSFIHKIFLYIDKSSISHYPIDIATTDIPHEIFKKIKYAKHILTKLIKSK